jgi:hypothetical protein
LGSSRKIAERVDIFVSPWKALAATISEQAAEGEDIAASVYLRPSACSGDM